MLTVVPGPMMILETHKITDKHVKQKPASLPDKITVDFHADTERIPKRVSIVTDSNRKDYLVQEKYKKQREDDIRFKREVEAMPATKRLQSI